MTTARAYGVMGALTLVAVTAVLLSIGCGSDGFSLRDLGSVLTGRPDNLHAQVLYELRMPRVVTAFTCGGLLALAGALMQVLFRNALADPFVLGLAGGAGAGALAAMAFGAGAVSVLAGSWCGALISVALLLLFGRDSFRMQARSDGGRDVHRLLLTGVALASGWGAIITLVLALASDASLKGLMFWTMGDLDAAEGWQTPAAALVFAFALARLLASDLNALSLGEATAQSLGVSIHRLRLFIMLLASIATGAAVTTAGTIGFVGLVVPNAVRWGIGSDQRLLLPGSVVAGGTLLVIADTVARTVIAPMQLPVGAIVALLGVPSFIFLLARGRFVR